METKILSAIQTGIIIIGCNAYTLSTNIKRQWNDPTLNLLAGINVFIFIAWLAVQFHIFS